MKYECENCGAFYSDEDVTEEGEMREDYLGVRFWATFHYCPSNGSSGQQKPQGQPEFEPVPDAFVNCDDDIPF